MDAPVGNNHTGEPITQYFNRRMAALGLDFSDIQTHLRDISDFMLPRATRFFATDKNRQGNRRNTKIINNTATMGLGTAAAGLMSGVTSPSRPWMKLSTANNQIKKKQSVKIWLDDVTRAMSEIFIKSNLYTTLPVAYEDLLAFGTTAFALMEDEEDVIRCYAFPVGSYVLSVNGRGVVNACFHRFQMSVDQLVKTFGLENCCIDVQEHFRMRRLDVQIDVVHVVEENPDAAEGKLESRYLPFRSVYYERKSVDNKVLSFKGLHEMAIMAPRWRVCGEDTWGSSPAMNVLGDVKQLQQMEKRKLQALDMLIDPPRSVPMALKDEYVGTLAGEKTFIPDGSIGAKVEANYVINPYMNHISQEIQNVEQRIKHGLYVDLFLMIADIDRGGVTATEIQARQQEKMMALGPVMERLNDELLDLIVRRTYAIMERKGLLPEAPEELNGQPLMVEYISIMAQAMKLQGVVGVERLVNFIGTAMAIKPESVDKINMDDTIDAYADMVGVPPNLLYDAETTDATRAARAKREQMSQMMAMAQQGAAAAKDFSQANATSPQMLQQMAGVVQQAGPMGMQP